MHINLLFFLLTFHFGCKPDTQITLDNLPLEIQEYETDNKSIQAFARDNQMQGASISFCVLDIKTGKTVSKYDPNRVLTTASTLKTLTTSTALGILGKDYRFKTELRYDGVISNGTLKGNIYIKGYGDPTLGSDQLEQADALDVIMSKFVEAIRKEGIRNINGKIVGDGTYFESQLCGDTWQWNDLGNYYAGGVSGLNIHENMYYLKLQQRQKTGQLTKIKNTKPDIPYLNFQNEVIAKGRGDNAYIYGSPYANNRYVRGSISPGSRLFTIKGSIPDPAYFTAFYLKNALKKAGIKSKEATTQLLLNKATKNITSGKVFYTHKSPNLKDIVYRTNMKSVNMYCESMLKTMGQYRKQKGSYEVGIKVVKEFWKDRGLDLENAFMEDGSGLSARNAFSAYHIATMMRKTALDKGIYPSFFDSLPQAGKTGTIRNMFKGTAAVGRLRAKSGTIKHVRSYAGYVKTKTGKQLAFSFIVNNFKGSSASVRRKMEKVMVSICL